MRDTFRNHRIIFFLVSALIVITGLGLSAGLFTPEQTDPGPAGPDPEPEIAAEEDPAAKEEADPEEIEAEEEFNWREWEPPEPGSHTNILILGLDDQGMSDAMMIFSYDNENYESSLIALKRDTYVKDQTWAAGEPGASQLTYAHYFGMGEEESFERGAVYALLWVEYLLGLPLHGYASITFDGFVELIDHLGGVSTYVDPGFSERDNNPLPAGTQTLNGEQALTYVRHRSNPRIPEPGSDSEAGDRVRRNLLFMQSILERCKELEEEQLNVTYEKIRDNLHTNLDDWDLMRIANIYYHTEPAKLNMLILPGESVLLEEEPGQEPIYYYMLNEKRAAEILHGLGLLNREQ